MTGLGLRACEIAGLRLGDIGWQTGSLRIRGKGDRVDELPLPDEVGQALEDYVLHGRGGRVQGEEVFWTVIDPVQPLTANGVCGTIRQICMGAGVTKFGPHRLRQTFATGMLASGATLQEVQGLLRHAHLRTTAIYTKVDKNRLTQLAPEWPAAASGQVGTMSELRELLDSYLATRRALGFKLTAPGKTLDAFVAWMDEAGEPTIRRDLATAWVSQFSRARCRSG